jgi:hypothetical protein
VHFIHIIKAAYSAITGEYLCFTRHDFDCCAYYVKYLPYIISAISIDIVEYVRVAQDGE